MKRKILALMLAFALAFSLLSLAGCKENATGTGGDKAGTTQTYRRMKRLDVRWGGEHITVDCAWDDDGCTLFFDADGEKEEMRISFDRQTGVLSCSGGMFLSAGTVLEYDGDTLVKMGYCGSLSSGHIDVTVRYEDDKIIIRPIDDEGEEARQLECEYDSDSKTVKVPAGEQVSDGVVSKRYYLNTLDDFGNVLKQERLVLTDADGDGVFEEENKLAEQLLFEYDDGNLVKIWSPQDDSAVWTYEYYDEPVAQPWERTTPLWFLDDGAGFDIIPFFGLFESRGIWICS